MSSSINSIVPFPRKPGFRGNLSREFHWLRWDEQPSFQRRLEQNRLILLDHLGTPLLETLAANRPMLAYWKPSHWEVREEALPYLEELRQAGILLEFPEAAAGRTVELHPNPSEWWNSRPVQEARERFVQRYALSETKWEQQWSRALNNELSLA